MDRFFLSCAFVSFVVLLGWCAGAQGKLVFYMSFDDDTFAVDTNLCPAPSGLISPAGNDVTVSIANTNPVSPGMGRYAVIPGANSPITFTTSPDLGTVLFDNTFAHISMAAWVNLDPSTNTTGVALPIFETAGSTNEPKLFIDRFFLGSLHFVPRFLLGNPLNPTDTPTKPLTDCEDINPPVGPCPTYSFLIGQWHHIAATFDGAMHMYIDGVEQGLPVDIGSTTTYAPWTMSQLIIGGNGAGQQFVGLLDDLRIYDHALLQSEVDALFAKPPSLQRPTITTVNLPPSTVVVEGVSQALDISVQGTDPGGGAVQYFWEDITTGCQLLSFQAPNAPDPGILLTGIGPVEVAAGVSNGLCASEYFNFSVIGSAAALAVNPVNGSFVYLNEYTDTFVVVTGFPTPAFQWEIQVVRTVVRANDSAIITQSLFIPIPGQIGSTLHLLNLNNSFPGVPSRRASGTPIVVHCTYQNKFSSSVGVSADATIVPLDTLRPSSSSGDGGDGTVAAIVVPVVVGPILLCLCCLLLLLLLLAIFAIVRRRGGGGEWRPDLTEPDYDALAYGKFLDTPPSVSKKQLAALKKLEELLLDSDYLLTRLLCDNAKATEADNVAKVITYLYAAHGEAVGLVQYFITKEVESSNKEGTLFRANSISSKMFTTYSRVIALEYVWTIFAYPVAELDHMAEVASGESGESNQSQTTIMGPMAMEVDPSKMDEAADDQINTLELWLVAQKLFSGMVKAKSSVPSEVRLLLRHVQTEVASKFSEQAAHKAMGGFLFLRLLCPSLMAPQVYGLLKAPPNTMAQRQLILLAKVMQNLANDTLPGKKEGYMQRLNEFITSNQDRLRSFYADLIAHAEDGPHRRPSVPDNVKTNSLIQLHRYISVNYDKLSAVVQQEDEGLAEELQEVMDSIGNIDSDEL